MTIAEFLIKIGEFKKGKTEEDFEKFCELINDLTTDERERLIDFFDSMIDILDV